MTPDISVSPTAVQTLWFYADASNQPIGPLPFTELQRLAAAGAIRPETLVIENGGGEWRSYASVCPLQPPPLPTQQPSARRKILLPAIGICLGCLTVLGGVLSVIEKTTGRKLATMGATKNSANDAPPSKTATTDAKRTFHESDFAYIFTGLDDYRTVGDAGVCNLAGLVGAIYDGTATIKQASRYAFRITAVDADFKRVVGDYLLYAAVTPQGKPVEFAMRRDAAYEREQLKLYKTLDDFYAENKGALSSGDQLRQGEVVIVGAEQFATETGIVKQIPVVQCVRIENSPAASTSNAKGEAAARPTKDGKPHEFREGDEVALPTGAILFTDGDLDSLRLLHEAETSLDSEKAAEMMKQLRPYAVRLKQATIAHVAAVESDGAVIRVEGTLESGTRLRHWLTGNALTRYDAAEAHRIYNEVEAANRKAVEIKPQIEKAMKAIFGKELRRVDVTPQVDGGFLVLIEYRIESIGFVSGAKYHIETAMQEAYQKLYTTSAFEVKRAVIGAVIPLVDKYGNESEGMGYQTILEGDEAQKIRWEKANELDFKDIWKTKFLHPSFRR